jgi:hypothetical protein
MDWQKAKDAGVQFAFVKATEGANWIDPTFAYNWQESRRLKIPHGAYHFFRPADDDKLQVRNFIELVQPEAGELLVLDLEDTGGQGKPLLTLTVKRALDQFYEMLGRYPLIYSRASWLNANINIGDLPKLDYWLAQYRWALPYPLFTAEYPSDKLTAPTGIERQQIKFHQSGEKGNGGKFGAQSYYIDTDRFLGSDLASYFNAETHNVYLPIVTMPEPEPEPEPEPDPEPEPTDLPYEARVTASSLIVRDAPAGKDTGARLKKGAQVTILEEEDNWASIYMWVSKDWIERVNNLPPAPPPSGTLAVEPMSQNDPRWKNNRLGTSSTTIGWNGCLLTCIAMVCNYYSGEGDPAKLNAWLTANNGYTNGNLYNWNSIAFPISTWVDCYSVPAPLSQIDAALARGEPVIVHVDFYPSTNPIDEHYVLLIGKLADEDYVMIDSWDGFVGSFKSRYKDARRFVYRIVSYRRQP